MTSQNHIAIRFGNAADAPILHVIIQEAYRTAHGNAWTTEAHLIEGERISLTELQSILSTEATTQPILVAERTEEGGDVSVLGCIQIQLHDCAEDEAMFGLLSVSPALQGCGIGGQLTRAALAYMKQVLGKRTAKLWVLHSRVELIAWYEKLGFRNTDMEKPFFRQDLAKQDIHFVAYTLEL